eukprot:4912618-Amphidinium_carterae.3
MTSSNGNGGLPTETELVFRPREDAVVRAESAATWIYLVVLITLFNAFAAIAYGCLRGSRLCMRGLVGCSFMLIFSTFVTESTDFVFDKQRSAA